MEEIIDLKIDNGISLSLNRQHLKNIEKELYDFLDNIDYVKTLKFAKSVLLRNEIKSNNSIEGINDDIYSIKKALRGRSKNITLERQRIINLYHGYQYILNNKTIDKESLRNLYNILSKDILETYDKVNMGEYYRLKPVYILKGGYLNKTPFMGIDERKIDYYMNKLFEYINDDKLNDNEINKFIKSQIIHFYFVYIHPYFDVNGRTSRTVAMWYLLNNKTYPYIIFNRAIAFSKSKYEHNIIKGRINGDITLFIEYMLNSVLTELEKFNFIHNIESNVELTEDDKVILDYILTIKSNLTIKDLAKFYNKYNEQKKVKNIYIEKIMPLIDKNIIVEGKETKSFIDTNIPNRFLKINSDIINIDPSKVKHLNYKI